MYIKMETTAADLIEYLFNSLLTLIVIDLVWTMLELLIDGRITTRIVDTIISIWISLVIGYFLTYK